ncbi:MAG: hypothetical protein WC972_04975 [Trueperaceae bacterium]
MTPALKAMVEAMAAELERQADKGGSEPHFARLPGLHETHYFSGNLDLEKVARAGLEAIKPPHPLDVDDITHKGSFAEYALRDAIDAILTPTTGEGNG